MSKENFINKSTLMFISSALLLALFCTMGMSFTPATDDKLADPNDSTYVSGPRRSHWETGGCNSTTYSEDDFGKVIATSTGNGSVTLTSSGGGTVVSTTPTSGTSSTSVTIVWKCGEKGKGANQGTAANHTRSFTFKATHDAGYNFAGWWTEKTGGTKVSGDETYTVSQELDEWNSAAKYTSESAAKTLALYARFKEPTLVTVTFAASPNGSYTYTCAQGNGTVNSTTSPNPSVSTSSAIALKATPAPGYKFYGWYTLSGTTESFISYSAEASVTLDVATTIYAKFIPSNAALFQVVGESATYYDLNVAATAALSATKKIVVPTADGTLYNYGKDYTIPSGVTLLIPFDAGYTCYTTQPTWPKQAPSGQSAYRKLTLKSGVNIVVNGAISVSAQSQGNQPYGGCVYGKYGQIDMESGSTITINSSANLYCWGYITGGGAITAKSGAKVYEDFQLTCWRGGTAASTMNSNASSKGVFPLAQYYIQNIEAPLTLEAGALEYTCTAVTALSSVWDATVQIVGTNSGLFHISSGSITKWYDAAKDRQMYSINGNTKLGAVVVDVSVTISSEKFVLPVTNNMDITVASGTLTCDQRVALLPGARIVIDEGATVKFDSGSKLFIYDKDEWKGSYNGSMVSYNYPGNATHLPAPYSPTCSSIKTLRTFDKMDDAELDVNGTLEMTGALYTTIHGANVRSSNGTGIIKYKTSAGTESVTYQAFQGGSGGTEITWQNISITSAKLHNSTTVTSAYGADLEYLATAGTAANTTITYKNGHWGWMEIWKDHDGTVLKAINTIAKTTNGTAPSNPSRTGYSFTGWSAASEDATKQEVTHTAQYDPIYSTVTFNANGHGTAPADITNVEYNTTITAPTAPTAAEWVFSGWYKEAACTNAWTFSSDKVTADITLFAKWVAAVASVTPEGGSATYHATIADAFTTANTKTNPIVKMLQNTSTTSQITISAAMTIDLNDKTISATQASASGVFKIDASGNTVTIKDSGTNGKIDHTASYNGKLYGVWLTAGSLKIEGGKIYTQNDAAASNDYRAYGIWTDGSASSITMSEGTIEATSKNMAFGIYCGNNCAITMTGGEIYSHGNTSIRGIYIQGTTKLTDATITSTATSTDSRTFYIKTGTNLTINSGTYTATGATGSIQVLYQQAGKVTINGGRFSATDVEFIKDAGTTTIKGGYYVHDTNLAANCATNYHVLSLTGEEPYKYKVAEAYTVTFNNHNGTQLQSGLVEKGKTPTYDGAMPTKAATAQYTYTFDGWDAEIVPVTGNATYNATFTSTPQTYTVTLNTNEGTINAGNVTGYTYGVGATLPTNVTRTGYEFGGWYENSGLTGSAVTSISTTATGNKTYWAKWTVHTHKFAWDFAGGSTSSTTHTAANNALAYGSAISYPAYNTMTKTGYTFASWSSSATAMPDEDLTITANWTANTNTAYTVKHYQQNLDGSYPSEPTEIQNLTGTTGANVTPEVMNYEGFTAPSTQTKAIAAAGTMVVEYQYTRNSYTVRFNANGGDGTMSNESFKYDESKALTSNTFTRTGYTFAGWATSENGEVVHANGETVSNLSSTNGATVDLYAKWTVITCTITWKVDDQPDETTEVALGQAPVYPHGTPGKAQTNQNTFTFEGWSDGKTAYGKDETLPSVTGPATYTAQFMDHIRYYTITWKDWDGTELEKDEGEAGQMQWGAQPSYDGGVPTRDGDDVRSYSFKGWYPEITAGTKVSGDQEYTAQYNMDIKAKTAEPVAVTSDETARITTVAVSGKLNVGAHLTTEDLILEATPSTSGEITGGGTITATRTFFDLSNGTEGFKARTWYAVAVPWGVIVPYSAEGSNGGVYLKIGDKYERQQLGKTYDLIYYDGESRAQGKEKAWRYVEDDQKEHKTHDMMEPGRAYMIYLTSDAEVIRFQKHSDSRFNTLSVDVKKHESSITNDYKSWNGIANPATYHADLNEVGAAYGQVYIDPIKRRYEPFDMSKKLVVGQPVFVQVPDETFKSYGTEAVKATISVSAPSLVRRRAKEQVSLTCYELLLAASDADVTDRVIVRMDEEKTENEYVIGKDLVKMGVSDLVPQMWINRYEKKMCVNTEAGYANTADYPLGIFVPKKGEYDLFIDDQPNNETMLYLTYDGEAIWNLSYGGYVASLEKGTNTHYGLRIVKKAPQITTGIEETTIQNGEAVRKVLVNDKVYIIRNGEIYSVTGQKAK